MSTTVLDLGSFGSQQMIGNSSSIPIARILSPSPEPPPAAQETQETQNTQPKSKENNNKILSQKQQSLYNTSPNLQTPLQQTQTRPSQTQSQTQSQSQSQLQPQQSPVPPPSHTPNSPSSESLDSLIAGVINDLEIAQVEEGEGLQETTNNNEAGFYDFLPTVEDTQIDSNNNSMTNLIQNTTMMVIPSNNNNNMTTHTGYFINQHSNLTLMSPTHMFDPNLLSKNLFYFYFLFCLCDVCVCVCECVCLLGFVLYFWGM